MEAKFKVTSDSGWEGLDEVQGILFKPTKTRLYLGESDKGLHLFNMFLNKKHKSVNVVYSLLMGKKRYPNPLGDFKYFRQIDVNFSEVLKLDQTAYLEMLEEWYWDNFIGSCRGMSIFLEDLKLQLKREGR